MTESEIDRLTEDFRAELSDEEEDLLDIEDNEAATVPPPRPHHHPGHTTTPATPPPRSSSAMQVCKPFYTDVHFVLYVIHLVII